MQAYWVSDDSELQNEWLRKAQYVREVSEATYQWALGKGIAKECARVVLPEGLTMSRLYVDGTIRSWIHYCQVRTDVSTQLEHRKLALACADEIEKVWPDF
jgi:thymidylate synthase (FAD)